MRLAFARQGILFMLFPGLLLMRLPKNSKFGQVVFFVTKLRSVAANISSIYIAGEGTYGMALSMFQGL